MAEPFMLKLVLHWKGFGEEGTIGWHFKGNAAVHTPTALSTAASAAAAAWGSVRTPSSKTGFLSMLLAAQQVDSVTLYEYAVSQDPVTHKQAKATGVGLATLTTWPGTSGAVNGPLQEAFVATLRTNAAGKSYRGRQYFPGHTIAMNTGSMLAPNASADALRLLASNMGPEAAAAIAGSLNISTLTWAVYSPTLDIMTPITSCSVDNKTDTQRRRAQSLKSSYTTTGNV